MSLDVLLKDAKHSPAWNLQRSKLLQVITGTAIIALSLFAGVVFILHAKNSKATTSSQLESSSTEVDSVAQLIELKNEAKKLNEEIVQLRKPRDGSTEMPVMNGMASSKTNYRPPAKRTIHEVQVIDYDPGKGFSNIEVKKKSAYIPMGAVFQAVLITPIKTSLSKTFVIAETTSEFRMDMNRKIPKGSRLIGNARLNQVLKGVIVEFDHLVLPNGIETDIKGLALSRNALPEISGLYFSNDLENYGTALAFGFLSGFSDSAKEREPTIFGSQPKVSIGNQVLSGLSTASFQIADDILRNIRTRAIEYVVVPAGKPVLVALTSRYIMAQGESE